jgi:hypothetical protein
MRMEYGEKIKTRGKDKNNAPSLLTHFPFTLSKPVAKTNNAPSSPAFLSPSQNPCQRQTMHPPSLPPLTLAPKTHFVTREETKWLHLGGCIVQPGVMKTIVYNNNCHYFSAWAK